MISMIFYVTVALWVGICSEEVLSELLQTVTITENDNSIHKLVNLTEIISKKMKIPDANLREIDIVAEAEHKLSPFKLQANQLLQPTSGVDREAICPEKSSKIHSNLCQPDECCKLIGFQYQIQTDISTFFVLVKVLDRNDKVPQFAAIKRPFARIPENVEIGYTLDLPVALDSDSEKYSVQRYSLASLLQPDLANDFRLHVINSVPPKPQLVVSARLDYERATRYRFRLQAFDFDEKTIGNSCSTTVEIEIDDLNDNAPKFNQLSYQATIEENRRSDRLIKFSVADPDGGRNGLVSVAISERPDESTMRKFQILETGRNEGYLGLVSALDYESEPALYEFALVATDQGSPALSSTARVRVQLKNVNDNGPVIRFKRVGRAVSSSVSLTEGLRPHSLVVEVRVTDADSPTDTLACRLLDHTDLFYLDGPSKFIPLLSYKPYTLKTVGTIDREASHSAFVRLTLQCSDGDLHHPMVTNESLNVQIEDVNDNAPLFSQQTFVGNVDENRINAPVDFLKPISVSDLDSGQNGKFEFRLLDFANSSDSADFFCDRLSGKIVTQRALDYEARNAFRFKVVATDNGAESLSSSATVSVHVHDLNDNAPRFPESHYIFNVAENATVGWRIGTLVATDADTTRKNKEVFYSIEPKSEHVSCIEIDRVTGDLRTRKALDREAFESITFRVLARNQNHYSNQLVRTSESEVDVIVKVTDVNDNSPQFKPRPHTKSRVEFVMEQYVEGSTCAELPYTVHDADDGGGAGGSGNGHSCCVTTLENDHNKLFSLMSDTPSYICLSRRPDKYQSLTVTLVARDKPANPAEALTSKISFPVIIKTDPNLRPGSKSLDNKEPNPQSYNDSKNLIIIGILTTVVLVVIIIIIIIIIIIRRCSMADRDCDNNKCYQAIDLPENRNEGTKVNYIMSEQGSMLQSPLSPGKGTIPRGYMTSHYGDSLHKTMSGGSIQQMPASIHAPMSAPTYHHIITNPDVRIIQNPNQFNDQYIYGWSPASEGRDRTSSRTQSSVDKMQSMSPSKSGSIHASSKLLNEYQQDSGYQILNPFELPPSRQHPQQHPQHQQQQHFIHYPPGNVTPCENDLSLVDSRSLTILNNFFDENNNGANKPTPGTMKKNYFQTTFV